jgi:hypothetical protein
MLRLSSTLGTIVAFALSAAPVRAQWPNIGSGGYQPWCIYAKRYKNLTPEEERLQKFWHDYYDAMRNYYAHLDHIDWVAYYKNHGYLVNSGKACCPTLPPLQWAAPSPFPGGPMPFPTPGQSSGNPSSTNVRPSYQSLLRPCTVPDAEIRRGDIRSMNRCAP